jgi:hypothetical protein
MCVHQTLSFVTLHTKEMPYLMVLDYKTPNKCALDSQLKCYCLSGNVISFCVANTEISIHCSIQKIIYFLRSDSTCLVDVMLKNSLRHSCTMHLCFHLIVLSLLPAFSNTVNRCFVHCPFVTCICMSGNSQYSTVQTSRHLSTQP